MTIDLTEEQVAYLQEYLNARLEENLDCEEFDILQDLYEKLSGEPEDNYFMSRVETDVEPISKMFTKEDFDEAFEVPRNKNQVEMFDTDPDPE